MHHKMNIIIVGTAYPYKGGLASFNERLAKELSKENNVEIITFTLQYPNFLFPGKTQYSEEQYGDNIEIKRMINAVNPLSWYKTGKYIKSKKPDLVIVKFWLPFMAPAFGSILRIAKNSKTKVISILDNVIPHEKRIGDVAFTKYFIKPIDAFLAMSKEVLADLRKFTTTKPAIYAPHPVYDNYGENVSKEAAFRFLKLDSRKKYILFFGFIRKYKGLDLLLKAMAEVRKKNPEIELIIAGEFYDDAKEYQNIINELNLQDQIHLFNDFIPNDDVKYFFSAADLVVQPYKSATQSGISQIAYHFEVPMIVTNVGGLPEIVPNNIVGRVVPPNEQDIADAILDTFKNNKIEHFQKNIKQEKQKFGWEFFVEQLLSLKKELK